jgi:2-polyprenyl-3-methyl-5-hydroxy-6-metoxy-1,4-benzoquinol methylase
MKYEPIKDKLSSIIGKNRLARRILYSLLGIVFLREWHVKRELRTIFRTNKISDVLDAGCGFGQYSYYIAKRLKAKVCGVDINSEEINKCKEFANKLRMEKLSFDFADLENLDFHERFDLIVSVDVMEHIKDDNTVFRNFNRALRKGGKVLISTPSNFGGSDVHDNDEHSFIEEHFRNGYSSDEITSKLEAANLDVDKIRYTYGRIGNWYWKLAIKLPVKMLNKSFALLVFLPFYYILVMPISLLFMLLDYFCEPKRGSGMLIVASKNR